MPIYDYVCGACGHEFELFQSITEQSKRKCPQCGRQKLRRLIGPGAAIVFKGSGFYKTDYRSEAYKKAAAADSANGGAAAAASSAKGKEKGKEKEKGQGADTPKVKKK